MCVLCVENAWILQSIRKMVDQIGVSCLGKATSLGVRQLKEIAKLLNSNGTAYTAPNFFNAQARRSEYINTLCQKPLTPTSVSP